MKQRIFNGTKVTVYWPKADKVSPGGSTEVTLGMVGGFQCAMLTQDLNLGILTLRLKFPKKLKTITEDVVFLIGIHEKSNNRRIQKRITKKNPSLGTMSTRKC